MIDASVARPLWLPFIIFWVALRPQIKAWLVKGFRTSVARVSPEFSIFLVVIEDIDVLGFKMLVVCSSLSLRGGHTWSIYSRHMDHVSLGPGPYLGQQDSDFIGESVSVKGVRGERMTRTKFTSLISRPR